MKTLQAILSYYHNREKADTKFMVDSIAQAIIEAAEQDFGIDLEDIEEVERAIKELEGDEDKKLTLGGSDGVGDEDLYISWNSMDGYCLDPTEDGDKYAATWVEVKDISKEISNREKELRDMFKPDLIKHILELEFNS